MKYMNNQYRDNYEEVENQMRNKNMNLLNILKKENVIQIK